MVDFIELLKKEVVPAEGCTEPIAVAYAVSIAAEQLEGEPTDIRLKLSANIIKNALGVGIPGTGMVGLPIAIALGALVGKSAYQLEVLKDSTPADVEQGKQFIAEGDQSSILAGQEQVPLGRVGVLLDGDALLDGGLVQL